MRKAITVVISVTALVLPSVDAWAATTAQHKAAVKKKVVTIRKAFTGAAGSAGQWGEVQVLIVVSKTTTTVLKTKHKTILRKITAVKVPVFPNHTSRSVFINQQALPYLIQETLQAQSTGINLISGATYTSDGFAASLQSAILQARVW
ncbi:MAG TPA: FMN-binding protein [Gaiellaceae bacterium]|nr:FMN-binding protein [Gaiellaceae bacterium]